MTRRDWYGLAVASPVTDPFDRVPEVMPRRRRVGRARSATATEWLRAHLIAFDERRSSPLTNLGTLGAAGDATATGTRRLVNTGVGAFVWNPGGTASITANCLTVPDAANLRITGDLDIAFRVGADDWTPSNLTAFGGKDHLSTGRGYALALLTTGRLRLYWSPLGTDASAVFRDSTVAVPFTDGQAGWVRVTLDVDNGAAGHDVRFWTAADSESEPTTWTQLGTTVTTAGTTSIFATTQSFSVGYARSTSLNWAGNVHRCILKDAIGGATVLDVDTSVLTDEGATSFTATTGQTVTINRSTSAVYKSSVLLPGSAKRLFNGTSDYLTVADNAALRFTSSDPFTIWALVRRWATPPSAHGLISKDTDISATASAGWGIRGTATDYRFALADGTTQLNVQVGAETLGSTSFVAAINSGSASRVMSLNGTLGTTNTTSLGSLSNTAPLRAGSMGGTSGSAPIEFYAWGVYAGAMTAAQLAALRDALLVPERAAA